MVSPNGDCWSQQYTRQQYVGYLVNFLNKEEKKTTRFLGCTYENVSHTSKNLTSSFQSMLNTYAVSPKQLLPLTTDQASNEVAMSEQQGPLDEGIFCYSHRIHIVVDWALKICNSIKNILDKLTTKVIDPLRNNSTLGRALFELQVELGLFPLRPKTFMHVRWNSIRNCLKRIFQLEHLVALQDVLEPSEICALRCVLELLEPLASFSDGLMLEDKTKSERPVDIFNVLSVACNTYHTLLHIMTAMLPLLERPAYADGVKMALDFGKVMCDKWENVFFTHMKISCCEWAGILLNYRDMEARNDELKRSALAHKVPARAQTWNIPIPSTWQQVLSRICYNDAAATGPSFDDQCRTVWHKFSRPPPLAQRTEVLSYCATINALFTSFKTYVEDLVSSAHSMTLHAFRTLVAPKFLAAGLPSPAGPPSSSSRSVADLSPPLVWEPSIHLTVQGQGARVGFQDVVQEQHYSVGQVVGVLNLPELFSDSRPYLYPILSSPHQAETTIDIKNRIKGFMEEFDREVRKFLAALGRAEPPVDYHHAHPREFLRRRTAYGALNSAVYPLVNSLLQVLDILEVSSVGIERTFSLGRLISNYSSTSLLPSHFNQRLFVAKNSHLIGLSDWVKGVLRWSSMRLFRHNSAAIRKRRQDTVSSSVVLPNDENTNDIPLGLSRNFNRTPLKRTLSELLGDSVDSSSPSYGASGRAAKRALQQAQLDLRRSLSASSVGSRQVSLSSEGQHDRREASAFTNLVVTSSQRLSQALAGFFPVLPISQHKENFIRAILSTVDRVKQGYSRSETLKELEAVELEPRLRRLFVDACRFVLTRDRPVLPFLQQILLLFELDGGKPYDVLFGMLNEWTKNTNADCQTLSSDAMSTKINDPPLQSTALASLTASLQKCGLRVVHTLFVGNCQYEAVIASLNAKNIRPFRGVSLTVPLLRRSVHTHLKDHRDEYGALFDEASELTFDTYCKNVLLDKVWGDNLTLYALCRILGVAIYVLYADGRFIIIEPPLEDAASPKKKKKKKATTPKRTGRSSARSPPIPSPLTMVPTFASDASNSTLTGIRDLLAVAALEESLSVPHRPSSAPPSLTAESGLLLPTPGIPSLSTALPGAIPLTDPMAVITIEDANEPNVPGPQAAADQEMGFIYLGYLLDSHYVGTASEPLAPQSER